MLKTKKKNYDSKISKTIFLSYVEDIHKSGRPLLGENLTKLVLFIMTQNSTNRNWSTNRIAVEICKKIKNDKTISARSVYIILKNNDFNSVKPIVKPGLTDANKAKRLAWCWRHRDWTLEDWKRVIWTDETSVNLSGPRGKRKI